VSSDPSSTPWWRRHAPTLSVGSAAVVALAWLMSPPDNRADGAEQVWAGEVPVVAPVAATRVAAPPILPPVAPPVEAALPERDWLPERVRLPEPAPARGPPDDLLDAGGDMALPPSLPAEVVEAPPPIGDLLLDDPQEPA
jgi:hypothetical protein